jgi:hypothetical protein
MVLGASLADDDVQLIRKLNDIQGSNLLKGQTAISEKPP